MTRRAWLLLLVLLVALGGLLTAARMPAPQPQPTRIRQVQLLLPPSPRSVSTAPAPAVGHLSPSPARPSPSRASRSRRSPVPTPRPHLQVRHTGALAGVVADCESGERRADGSAVPGSRRYHLIHYPDGQSTASGAYGFLDGTWQGVTGRTDRAYQAAPAAQDAAFAKLYATAGLTPWAASRSCWRRWLRRST